MNNIYYKMKYLYPTNIMLNVTDDCNLQCKYCFVEQKPHYMSLQTAKIIIDWAYQNKQKKIKLGIINKDYSIYIYFFGGEPMLCYKSIIVPLVQYCKEKYKDENFTFGITTNGTLLNKESIDFFKNNNFNLLLSIDGDEFTQNYNRPCKNNKSSFSLIKNNIEYLLKQFPNLRFRATIYPDTVQYLFENYLFAESLGFKYWVAIEDNRDPWSSEQIKILKTEITKIYFYRIKQIINNKRPMDEPRFFDWIQNTIILQSKNGNKYFNINKQINLERCGLGSNCIAIGWDGLIYGCQEQVSKKEKNLFLIGDLFNNGIDIKKHMQLLNTYYKNQIEEKEKKLECKNCDLCQLCKVNIQSCPSTNIDLFNNMNSITEVGCQIKKIYYENSLLFIKILSSFDNKDIQNYLENILTEGKIPYYG